MADQGPLVRVDTDGKGRLIKMQRKVAEEYVASHPGSRIAPARVRSDEPTPAEAAATAAQRLREGLEVREGEVGVLHEDGTGAVLTGDEAAAVEFPEGELPEQPNAKPTRKR